MKPMNPHLIRVIVVSKITGFLFEGTSSDGFFVACVIPTVSALYCFRLDSLTSSPTWLVADNGWYYPHPHLPEKRHKQPFNFNFLLLLFLCAWLFFCVCSIHQTLFYCESSQTEYGKTIESSAWWRTGLLKRCPEQESQLFGINDHKRDVFNWNQW